MRNFFDLKRGFLQISFAWLFAIIVGAVIIALAVFAVVKIFNIGETTVSSKTAGEIGVLLNPLETGFESAKTTSLTLPAETRIYNRCNDDSGFFGKQIITTSQKSFNEWTDTGVDVGFQNKYIFSDNPVEGRNFYIFSKPFEFPFKVSDLIYLTSSDKKYCFINSPLNIKEELWGLDQENILVDNCPGQESDLIVRVCFSPTSLTNCDMEVSYGGGTVEKDGETMRFETDALMYAAIFSEPDIYECQLKRLMLRTENLALLYFDKSKFVSQKVSGCNVNSELENFRSSAGAFEDSNRLPSLAVESNNLKTKNDVSNCKLW